MKVMSNHWVKRLSYARTGIIRLALPAALMLLTVTACRPKSTVNGAPPPQSPTATAIPILSLAPTSTIRSVPRQEKTISVMPTRRPQATPTSLPTPIVNQYLIISYAQGPITFEDPIIKAVKGTAVPVVQCAERLPDDDLFTIVTQDFSISRDFIPGDLVTLSDHLPHSVALGYPTEVRGVILQPLVDMIDDMLSADLQPQVLSGYRSYTAQAIAWNKWNTLYPDRAAIISAPPGHSEHQLGTVIDFGSPELPGIVGQPGIQFHTYFSKTSEGQWLAENAHKYGFTLSYSLEAFETTGFYYEPWHYRYVGESMARQLRDQNMTLTEHQLANKPLPCVP